MSFIAGKVALVTGGATGIGLAIVKSILEDGAKGVTILDNNDVAGKLSLSKLQNEFGDKVMFVHADVAYPQEFEDAFVRTVERFGSLDIVVNNASIYDETNWDRMVAVNMIGAMTGTKLAMDTFLPKYRSSEKGVIVNVASVAALVTHPKMEGYCATKHGLLGLGKSLSTDSVYNDKNVNVITICPGAVDTPMLRKLLSELTTLPGAEVMKCISPPEYISTNLVDMINSGKRGEWVLEDGEPPYKLKFPPKNFYRTEE